MSRFRKRPLTSRPLSRSPTAGAWSGSASCPDIARENIYPVSVACKSTMATGCRNSSALKYASITVAMTLEERIITVSAARFSISGASIVYLFGLVLHGFFYGLIHGYLVLIVLRVQRIENDRIHFGPPCAPGHRALDHAGDKLRVYLARLRRVVEHLVV